MDITAFIVEGRDRALLYGDYSTYHANLSKRLLNSRKKLGIATKNRGKFHVKDDITGEAIAANRENVYLSLLTSERAWARAMSIKAAHTSDQKGIVGRTRSHIISRLVKAARAADQLVEALSGTDDASSADLLEAKAYASMIHGAVSFEGQNWEPCLSSYSTCRVIYTALATSSKADIFRDLLSETIDPSIRYAAYRLKTPRTVSITDIARRAFPHSDAALVDEINKIDPTILGKEADTAATDAPSAATDTPRTITWRSREVKIEDAQIAVAWGAVLRAKESLSEKFDGFADSSPSDVAAAYDEILTTTQDAVDATKQAIDELRSEGVGQGDPRMQALQMTRTAVNYEMIIWRIGRSRVLTGNHDGAIEEYGTQGRRSKKEAEAPRDEKELPPSRKLAKLKEKVALYSGTLQNLQSIKDLPGVAADEELASRLDSFVNYFEALSILSVARSHAIIGNITNALALINHSLKLAEEAESQLPASTPKPTGPLSVNIGHDDVAFLTRLLAGELQRHRAIAHIDHLRKQTNVQDATAVPLLERLHEYPVGGVDLDNIVEFPPRMALLPVKPIFLDVAWNYIDYPGQAHQSGKAAAAASPAGAAGGAASSDADKQQPAKRGWFGFGRS